MIKKVATIRVKHLLLVNDGVLMLVIQLINACSISTRSRTSRESRNDFKKIINIKKL